MAWHFDSKNDVESLSGRAVKVAVDFTMQHLNLMFFDYSKSEFKSAVDFLKKCKKGIAKELDERIKMYEEKARGE